MIDGILLEGDGCSYQALGHVLNELGAAPEIAGVARGDALVIALSGWSSCHADLLELDSLLHNREDRDAPFGLVVVSNGPGQERALLQVLTRYQRLLPLENQPTSPVRTALLAHRALFDLKKPLVRADYDHALDTWRWLLRIYPAASIALQLAALFHDVERLLAETDVRVEHLAADYQGFKNAHARVGARLAARALSAANVSQEVVARAKALIEEHEAPREDPELMALNDADALSFFSLNAWGFVEYFGLEHTRKKVAYTLRRMSPAARRHLPFLRYHPAVASLLRETAPDGALPDEQHEQHRRPSPSQGGH
jgi:hypothetical protein